MSSVGARLALQIGQARRSSEGSTFAAVWIADPVYHDAAKPEIVAVGRLGQCPAIVDVFPFSTLWRRVEVLIQGGFRSLRRDEGTKMSPKSTTAKKPAEQVIKDIRRAITAKVKLAKATVQMVTATQDS